MANTKEIINCPNCGCEMKKVFSKENNFSIDICLDGCGGIFFDNQELKKFDETHENIDFILNAYQGKKFNPTSNNKTLTCPSCMSAMIKNKARFDDSTIIDECYSCGGIFLDYGELFKIREGSKDDKQKTEEFNKTLSYLYNEKVEESLDNNSNKPLL